MAILITGGTGFIGSHASVEFLNSGRDIVIVDNFINISIQQSMAALYDNLGIDDSIDISSVTGNLF
jgi:UDP-glucose 4-epimerase